MQNELEFERGKAAEVQEFLDSESVRLTGLIKEYKQEIKDQGENFNRDNPIGGMYSGTELTEIHYDMEQKMVLSAEYERTVSYYKTLRKAPYFARIDFKPEGADKPRTVYIGFRTLQDPDTFKMLVCDWRAPISSLFYEDFADEKAYFDAPNGRISGELYLKRQFKFKYGTLDFYIDSDLKINDDILRDVLSSGAGEHLKVIVNSIQREQNKVIRYSDNKNLLVLGPAGSGKTSVGFHRLAYLLYQNRNEISSSEIVMFSNNDIFSSYVADIIPELGETPISYASIYTIFNAEIPEFAVNDYYALADSIIVGDEVRRNSAKVKMSKEFIEFLDNAGESVKPEFSDITLWEDVIISKEALLERFTADKENTQKSRGERLSNYVQGVIDEYFLANKKIIYKRLDEDSLISEDTGKLFKNQRKTIKQNAVEMIREAVLINPVTEYFKLLKQYADKTNQPELLETKNSILTGSIEFEDALGIVYLKSVLGTSAVLSGVKHILVDEAQDLSLMQHCIIKRMFPRAKFTLLADTNQAIIPELNTVSSEQIASVYNAKTVTLNKSYRSTKQINEYALSLLPEDKRYDIFRRDGAEVETVSGGVEEVLKKAEEYSKISPSTCIIASTSDEASEIYEEMKDKLPGIRICNNMSVELSNNPIVMPLSLTKGLEFDNVIVVNKGRFNNSKYMYMASTRALHRLAVIELD
ncbi:MAG: UvrD-helicase domain-containing protein [Oscillospiraceae bacterium]|nr:UvrD-helicase domain-containing protein [Oscillospiraceae bacterium]